MKVRQMAMLTLLACGCASGDAVSEPVGTMGTRLVGGTTDTADRANVLIFIVNPKDATKQAKCSGTVVSPHVVLTAAHCIDPKILGPVVGDAPGFFVFMGDDATSEDQQKEPGAIVRVKTATFDPNFTMDVSALGVRGTTHDIGALVTSSVMHVTPAALNRTNLDSTVIGSAVRLVGFGKSSAGDTSSMGVRRQGSSRIADLDAEHIGIDADATAAHVCEGDSGGSTFLMRNGVESIIGVHSWADVNCNAKSYDTRVDTVALAFIDPLIASADPDFVPPGDGAATEATEASNAPDAGTSSGKADASSGNEAPAETSGGCAASGRVDTTNGAPFLATLSLTSFVAIVARRRRRRASS